MFDPYKGPEGTKEFGYVPVVNNLLIDAKVPVGVVNGKEDGPTLAVTGGLYPT